MATEKRERQKANRQRKLDEQRRDETRENTKKRALLIGGITAVVLIGLFVVYLTGRDDADETTTEDESTPLTLEDETDADAEDDEEESLPETDEPAVTAPEPGGSIEGPTDCPPEDGSAERITSFAEAPPECIDTAQTYEAEVTTTEGPFTITLDPGRAPATVNNFVVLARYHYYDGVPFHRIIPGFVIQGGDAVGDPLGTGGPGYEFDDELPDEGEYTIGSVAMANSGPDTNGSQFFVITGDDGAALPPSYSLFGEVTSGMDVVETIEAIPTTPGDVPTQEIYIESVTITEVG